jgi:thioredoxin reductase
MMYDAIIVGGSFAGLSAAMYIARARRSVCVIDAGAPRNRFADHSHGFFTQDGSAPGAMLAAARAQVAAYPTVRFVDGTAAGAAPWADGFEVTLDGSERLRARRLVLAFGIADELPALPGLAQRWGASVLHCPYCHGYEHAGRRLGVLNVSPMSAHQAMLIAEWGPATLFLDDGPAPDQATLAELDKRRVALRAGRVRALRGEGRALAGIELDDGVAPLDALFIGVRTRLNSGIAAQLGCAVDEGPFGTIIRTDEWRQTSVPGVFAAGDITRGAHSATWASADGVSAGVALHRSLVFPSH